MTDTTTAKLRRSLPARLLRLRDAALDQSRVEGHTHLFYTYPARFSPRLACTAIRQFSKPGDVVLDPFVGGGTTVVEALANGRYGVGCDLSSLATFVASAKTTFLTDTQATEIREWSQDTIPGLTYNTELTSDHLPCPVRTRNLEGRSTRHLRKVIALALSRIPANADPPVEQFLRCAVLRTSQWAFEGRSFPPTVDHFRHRLAATTQEMLIHLSDLRDAAGNPPPKPTVVHDDAANLQKRAPFRHGQLADLVVTSPPYPGVHVLYHRWQVRGRRETPAPFWITESEDGHGASFYTFGGRHRSDRTYFSRLLTTFRSIRAITRTGAFVVQVVGFQHPERQLDRYLATMVRAGFAEIQNVLGERIRRPVPSRRWHATLKGPIPSSEELVLVHQAT